ncbi:hypothetical protein PG999_004158 [Apiospora kogelbergensis]|uniref:Uncharacterized protein n=1 Tax=Apiospora kogelbergensis TaxID=1337665 RepID=A0AAW0R5R6_9PEZI
MSQATTASPSPPSSSASPGQDATADLHVTSTAPALVEWKRDEDDATTLLSDPDPRSHHITFQMRHLHDPEQPAASFTIHIPAKLKGSSRDTQILIAIPSDRVLSIDHESPVAAPNAKLGSRPLCRLTFLLRQPVDIIVPIEVPVTPLRAHKAATGQVLDLLPTLGRVTRLALYLPANAFSKQKLEPICTAIAEGRLEPTDRSDDLASLYSGSGGQVLRFDDPNDAPPTYDELPPSAPIAPLLPEPSSKAALPLYHDKNGRKRSRRDRDSAGSAEEGRSACCSTDEVMTALVAMRKQMAMQEDRVNEQSRRIDELERQATRYQEELAGAHKQTAQLRQELDDAQEQLALLQGRVETVEQEDLGKLDQDICGLREDVEALQEEMEQRGLDSEVENRITNTVTERVTSEMLDSGIAYNATVTFARP